MRSEFERGLLHLRKEVGRDRAEAALVGIYVIRTSGVEDTLSAEATVATSESLASLERDVHSMQRMDLKIHPVRQRLADRVRAHGFLRLLAAHLIWHLRVAWAPLERLAKTTPTQREAFELMDLPTR